MLPFFLLALASATAGLPPALVGADLMTGKTARSELASAPKATVVVFVSSVCPCSAAHEGALEALRAKYEAKGFRFVGIHSNQDETAIAAGEHFRASPLKFPILSDPGAKLADSLGALKTPHVFVADPRGEILYQGGVDDSHSSGDAKKTYLADALAAISEGKLPPVARTRSLGCVISRK